MTCPLAPTRGHRSGSKASLTCPYCHPELALISLDPPVTAADPPITTLDPPVISPDLTRTSHAGKPPQTSRAITELVQTSLAVMSRDQSDHPLIIPDPTLTKPEPTPTKLEPAKSVRRPRQPADRRTALRDRLLPSSKVRIRAAFIKDLDLFADELETETASRGKKANWLCPSLTGWANNVEGFIYSTLTEPQFRAELIRRHCPLWLAKILAASSFQLLGTLTSAIGSGASVSMVVRLLAIWTCPLQERCASYQENIFKLTFEGIVAKA